MAEHEIPEIEARQWWPLDFADEVMPSGRATPSAWLFKLPDGTDRCGEEQKDTEFPVWSVSEGDVVKFIASDNLGRARMTVEDDGSVRWDPRPPANAYIFDTDDFEMSGDGPDDFERNLRSFNELDPGETVEVYVTRWSNSVECRFTAEGGTPRFVALTEPPPAPEPPMAPPPASRASPDPSLIGARPWSIPAPPRVRRATPRRSRARRPSGTCTSPARTTCMPSPISGPAWPGPRR